MLIFLSAQDWSYNYDNHKKYDEEKTDYRDWDNQRNNMLDEFGSGIGCSISYSIEKKEVCHYLACTFAVGVVLGQIYDQQGTINVPKCKSENHPEFPRLCNKDEFFNDPKFYDYKAEPIKPF